MIFNNNYKKNAKVYQENGEYETIIFLQSISENDRLITENNKAIVNNQTSVPIAIYQELVEELKETKHKLEVIQQENKQLAQQNIWLREEVEKVVRETEKIQQFLKRNDTQETNRETLNQSNQKTAKNLPLSLTQNLEYPTPYTPLNHLVTKSEKPGLINSWLLALAIIAIIITTFGIGLLLLSFSLDDNDN